MNKALRIFIIAGEASGDLLGGNLMNSLKKLYPNIEFQGIGGTEMQAAGLTSLFPMEDLSVMGVTAVVMRLRIILSRMKQTVKAVLGFKPDVLITIDSPDFCFRIIKKVKAKNKDIPAVHYVAPSVWAWRPGRAKKVAQFLDHLLTLLPFEPPYFEKRGLSATFVGHPVVEKVRVSGDGMAFRQKYNIAPETPVLCLLPGSRMSEVDKMLPPFAGAIERVLKEKPDIRIVVPTLPHLEKNMTAFFKKQNMDVLVTSTDKFDAFAASNVALAASGTVTLELALHKTPHVIGYKLGRFSSWLAKQLIKTPFVNLINIIHQKPVVPEMLLEKCAPAPLATEVLKLMNDKNMRAQQVGGFKTALVELGLGATQSPGDIGAQAILNVAGIRLGQKSAA